MNTVLKLSVFAGSLLLSAISSPAQSGSSADELTFPVLQIGTRSYSNVTVTTKAKDYVFILHSSGMANLKVAELKDEELVTLGYTVPDRRTESQKRADYVKQTVAKVEALETPQVRELERQIQEKVGLAHQQIDYDKLRDGRFMGIVFGSFLVLYLFTCYCLSLICRKTGHPGGVMVWLPILQTFPLLRAANMSGWWFLALCVPVLNLVPQILWCFKISDARGKGILTAILLLLPVTNILAFLYLAFSSEGEKPEPPRRRTESLVLETA